VIKALLKPSVFDRIHRQVKVGIPKQQVGVAGRLDDVDVLGGHASGY
jgi:hypothetical protein